MKSLQGIPASDGIAVGPVFHFKRIEVEIRTTAADDPAAEWARLEAALSTARSEIEALAADAQQVGASEAAIFQAHRLFLDDPGLLDAVRSRVEGERQNVETAWNTAIEEYAAMLEGLDDPLFRARATDLRDVGGRVLRRLAGVAESAAAPTVPSVIIAAELTPSDTVQLDRKLVLAFGTAGGGPTSHAAILARALGRPAVVGLGPDVLDLEPGATVIVEGGAGQLVADPDAATVADALKRQAASVATLAYAQARAHAPAITRDGRRIEVVANLGAAAEVGGALAQGAEGVGLLRTEFLFLDRGAPPDEDEQVAAYQAILMALGGRPLIIRTLDIGGDKPVPYLDMGAEMNPFLGVRGLRLGLKEPDLLKTQLRAILRASMAGRVLVMFPMVTTVAEVKAAKAMLEEARAELDAAGIPHHLDGVGIMVEVPGAALLADKLAAELDFFSLGTNDLTQYTLAADRTNPGVAALADGLHPAVLRLIERTASAAHAAGGWCGVCGELAGDPVAAPILVGLGVDELSMSPAAIPQVKETIRGLSYAEAQRLAHKALELASAEEVRWSVGH
jgi:phosphoenolpyruvate-protein phosphotransferase